MKKFALIGSGIIFIGIATILAIVLSVNNSLPPVLSLEDYKPLLVTNVYSRDGKKVGEFFRERRVLVPYEKIPKHVVQAFLAAEDDQFFEHKGINYLAIARAFMANVRAGRTVQGGSTITQQVAKTLMLTNERTFTRKIKDILLAIKMEKSLTKEEILYLYLNQIYLGHSSYGVSVAAETYYRKPVDKLSLAEAAILAGMPQAPGRYSPIINPKRAKERQVYVLRRMATVGYVESDVAEAAIKEPVTVYVRENFEERAPFYLETVRQLLVKQIGEDQLLDGGLKVYTAMDFTKQVAAQKAAEQGLRDLDKRQGYAGPLSNITEPEKVVEFLAENKKLLSEKQTPARTLTTEGTLEIKAEPVIASKVDPKKVSPLPSFLKLEQIAEGVVTAVDDKFGLTYVDLPDCKGVIDFESMKWARKPNGTVRYDLAEIKKPSEALKVGDVIQVKLNAEKFASAKLAKTLSDIRKRNPNKPDSELGLPVLEGYLQVHLEQEPKAEAALVSLDLKTQDVLAMVGGRDFSTSKFNRAIQAARQTGSSFKSIVYASALDKGYTPATPIIDAPVVFEEQDTDKEGQEETKTWKPTNHGGGFSGDILFRNALIRSLNVPTVKIIEDIKVPWAIDYARRLGIFSKLNMDFTLALGSSSVTLYEMTKVFAHFGRMGKRIRPLLVTKVLDSKGNNILSNLSVDVRFEEQIKPIEEEFETRRLAYLEAKKAQAELEKEISVDAEDPTAPGAEELAKQDIPKDTLLEKEPPFFFEDPDQLINPNTAYLITSILRGTVDEVGGTGGRAKILGREVAGKTGTTNGYYDAWFIGYTPQISTGVWVGFDQEKTLGVSEVGGRSALPIWVDYMKAATEGMPNESFPVQKKIVFASIDNQTGKLPSVNTREVVRQAFLEGTEPSAASQRKEQQKEEETDFYKQDLSE